MNYLECNHCNFNNPINSERMVFCKECGKKINNNYTDWKKTKFDSSFQTYVAKETNEIESINVPQLLYKKKENLLIRTGKFLKSNTSSELKIFVASTILQIILFFVLINNSFTKDAVTAENKPYMKDVKWANYSISEQINLTLPFELKESKSILPDYLHNYVTNDKVLKAESSKSFSVTIEEFDVDEGINIDEKSYLTINDEYMQSPSTYITMTSPVDHLKIKQFNTSIQFGSYTMNNNKYLYENYTLISGNKAIKIIISYLDGDKLLRQYAGIVTQTLHQNISKLI
ncbi:MAG: hypothetical protein V4565_09155 [Bacteroidota bacterium]